VEVVRRRFCSEGEEAVGGDQSNARTFFVDRRVTSAAKAAINVNGDYGTAEAVPLSTTVQEQCGFSERCGMSAESWAKAPRLKPHAVMDVDYRGLKPVATPDMAGKKKPVQRAGVWESRPTWAMQARAVRRG
jgi:hypothetical protein